jgi:hypothetical protein
MWSVCSVALYATDEEAFNIAQALEADEYLRHHRYLCVHVLFKDSLHPRPVPINRLRNHALEQVQTRFLLHVDVDFVASPQLHDQLRSVAAAYPLEVSYKPSWDRAGVAVSIAVVNNLTSGL